MKHLTRRPALRELSRRRRELTELHASECNRLEKLECMQEPPEAIVRNVGNIYATSGILYITWRRK